MVELIRRKNAKVLAEDVSSIGKAKAELTRRIGSSVATATNSVAQWQKDKEREEIKNEEYKAKVQHNIDTAQEKIRMNQQKTFDASDKLVASDMAGRLKNDLLRWNLEQRAKNPNFIGTSDYEKAMRDYQGQLVQKYSQGLGQAGLAEFTAKTNNSVNEMVGNNINWAYQKKIKDGEDSAKQMAKTINDTATMYGANGDVDGYKEAQKENRAKLKDYMDNVAPNGVNPAMYELDKKSAVNFYTGMAETDPVKAKELLENPELFKETIPDEMLDNVNQIVSEAKGRDLADKMSKIDTGLAETKKGSPAYRELEKQKKQVEKDAKKLESEDNTDQSVEAIRKEVYDAVQPVLKKSLGENALVAKEKHEQDKVARFGEFLTLPTPENLKWFEEDNQMSYTPNVENMTEIPEEMKTKGQKSSDLIKNMMKYRENFGNVSMTQISDYKGTKQMFDDFKALAQADSDKDGNMDNVLLKSLVALNNAKQESISEKDYNNYQQAVNKVLYDSTYKNQVNQFIENTKSYLPDNFWDSPRVLGSKRTQLNEQMESRTRDVLTGTIAEWAKGEKSGADITKMYLAGVEKAYNDTVSDYLGIDMNQIVKQYNEKGFALANIHGMDYIYKGVDSSGNPIWEQVNLNTGTQAVVANKQKMGEL